MKRKLLATMAALALVLALPMGSAFAEAPTTATPDAATATAPTDASSKDAGNLFSTDDTSGDIVTQRDLVWFGQALNASGSTIGNDIIAAGQTIDVSNTTVGGSIRAAGETISIDNTSVVNNVTVAGQDIAFGSKAITAGMYAAGETVTVDGTADYVRVAAQDVKINGTVNGDVRIDAETVTIGSDAKISGDLIITASQEPTIASGATIGGQKTIDVNPEESASQIDSAEVAQAAGAAGVVGGLMSSLIWIIMSLVTALLLACLFRDAVEGSAVMVRTRTAALLVSGLIVAIVAPLAFCLMCGLFVTLPLAFALLFVMIALTIICIPFAGASLARLALPNLNRLGAACLGGAVVALLSVIPFVGGLVFFAAFMYTVGYATQAAWDHMKSKDTVPPTTPTAIPAPVATAPMGSVAGTPAAPAAQMAPVAAPTAAAPAAPAAPVEDATAPLPPKQD